jgi:hypothetical protein
VVDIIPIVNLEYRAIALPVSLEDLGDGAAQGQRTKLSLLAPEFSSLSPANLRV